MEKTFSKAFTYMFKDEDRLFKLGILILLYLPCVLVSVIDKIFLGASGNLFLGFFLNCVFTIISIVSIWITEGYYARCTQNIINLDENSKESPILPFWEDKFANNIKIGFVYNLAVFTAIIIPILLFMASYGNILSMGIYSTLLLIFLAIFSIYYTALKTTFCTDFKYTSFFNFKKASKLIANDFPKYVGISLIIFVLFGVYVIFAMALKSNLILTIFSPFAVVYVSLVSAYLKGMLFPSPAEKFFAQPVNHPTA